MELFYLLRHTPNTLQKQAEELLQCNSISEKFGLTLTAAQAQELVKARETALLATGRVEFAGGVLPGLIYAFCDSPFVPPAHYAETLAELQEIFYYFKNETSDALTDEELIATMQAAFNGLCQGSCDLLKDALPAATARLLLGRATGEEADEESEEEAADAEA